MDAIAERDETHAIARAERRVGERARDARHLEDYLARFDTTLAVMQTEASLERIAYELAEDAWAYYPPSGGIVLDDVQVDDEAGSVEPRREERLGDPADPGLGGLRGDGAPGGVRPGGVAGGVRRHAAVRGVSGSAGSRGRPSSSPGRASAG